MALERIRVFSVTDEMCVLLVHCQGLRVLSSALYVWPTFYERFVTIERRTLLFVLNGVPMVAS